MEEGTWGMMGGWWHTEGTGGRAGSEQTKSEDKSDGLGGPPCKNVQ